MYTLDIGTGEDPPGKAVAGHEVQSVMYLFVVPCQRKLTLFLLCKGREMISRKLVMLRREQILKNHNKVGLGGTNGKIATVCMFKVVLENLILSFSVFTPEPRPKRAFFFFTLKAHEMSASLRLTGLVVNSGLGTS